MKEIIKGADVPNIAPSTDEKQIAYSAWLEGQNQALRIHDVVGRSEQLVCVGCGRTEQLHTGNGKDICPNYGGRFKAN